MSVSCDLVPNWDNCGFGKELEAGTYTTRKTAFNDAQLMTHTNRGHAFVRALKINVSFPKFEG